MSSIPTIRLCSEKDLEKVYEVGASFFNEAKLPGKPVKPVFLETWKTFLSTGVGGILLLERDASVIGVLGFLRYPDPNDGELVVSETFWYVSPTARGHGIKLLNKFEELAKAIGAKRIMMAHMLSLMPEEISHLYVRKGYRPLETNYIKEIAPCST